MKRFISHTLAIILMTIASVNAQAQKNPFDRFADSQDLTYIYISKTMLKLVELDEIPNINGIELKKLGNTLESIQIITSNKKTKDSLKSEAMSIIKKETFERVMQVVEKDNNVDIYHKKGKDISIIAMVSVNKDKTVLIVFSGTFDLKDILQTIKTKK